MFRVTRIPAVIDALWLSNLTAHIFDVKPDNLTIHSLALDESDATEPEWRTATVSFQSRPTLLQPSKETPDEWWFDLPSASDVKAENSRICFDTHFKGFTPLSPVENDSKHTIEYVSPVETETMLKDVVAF